MKKNKRIIIFLIIILVLGILIFVGLSIINEIRLVDKNNDINDTIIDNTISNNIEYEEKETDFTLIDQYGNEQKLINYRGKKVVLVFWAVWCPPCQEEIPLINELNNEYDDAEFLTIVRPEATSGGENEDYKSAIQEYINNNNINVPVLIDEEKDNFKKYEITRYPSIVFIDENGDIKEKVGGKGQSGSLTKEGIIEKLES